ncbi:hypothetical protein EJ03DRAFT_101733 [Teratosphaeria nubilosa]|uniref:Uncharacterized protein n=1 Tax=Teratosphaeria nubilosa TaxID=161662 RepID=A0A6G1LLX8_9PEZI|nr:hypothetical protein EJ03DRAFT_101733 [Teratosphaeria nubilosa]
MPTYLLHGFRWPRPLIRIHIILQNLDDAAAEWLVAPDTTQAMLRNFHELYPYMMTALPDLRFVEQYDINDLSANAASQPYAYVADMVEEVKLSAALEQVTTRGISNDQWNAMCELRDKLAPEETIGWYIVVCGDEERWAPPTLSQLEQAAPVASRRPSCGEDHSDHKAPSPQEHEPKGLKKLFGSARRGSRKSRPTVPDFDRSRPGTSSKSQHQQQAPPLPDMPTQHQNGGTA